VLEGELVSIDCAACLDGWHADAAVTVPVGRVDAERSRLAFAVQDLLDTAIDLVRPGMRWSRIATILQEVALDAGYGLVEGFAGHGIGRGLHESPAVPSTLTPGLRGRGDFTLRPGMVFAIEPVLVAMGSISGPARRADGTAAGVPLVHDEDGWSVRTLDGAVAAHAEHTIAVGRRGATVLTDPDRRSLSQLLAAEEFAD
jgi:methionyl aminopeptidase